MLAVLPLVAFAFVCPPTPVEEAPKQLGEDCGGTCNSYGKCGDGLVCETEPTTSPLSFAILMGGTKKAGKCVDLAAEQGESRRLQRAMGGTMAGGSSEMTNLDDAELLAAAKFGVKTMMERSNSLTPATLSTILSAQRQVRRRRPAPPSPTACPAVISAVFFNPPFSFSPFSLLTRPPLSFSQVVAGMKYTITMEMSDGSHHRVQIVDQAWSTPRYTMLADEIV